MLGGKPGVSEGKRLEEMELFFLSERELEEMPSYGIFERLEAVTPTLGVLARIELVPHCDWVVADQVVGSSLPFHSSRSVPW